MTTAIQFENVSKRYRLGQVGTGTLSHDLHRAWAKFRGKSDPFAKVGQINNREEVGGEYVEQGEVLGIIGRNGAGKSTLFKLLSRISAPTEGTIKARGRIASLLEVGTGFHPELTGRENIYINGAILGMRRHEITRQLDNIIDFSGCAKYIDTPVKRYSSGMTVRVGFAVAAFLECEILVVDEVLAVGDTDFQKRCIGKMQELSRGGDRTVLFVSHNMNAVASLCTRGVLFNEGTLIANGLPEDLIPQYLNPPKTKVAQETSQVDGLSITDIEILNSSGETINVVTQEEDFAIRLSLHHLPKDGDLSLGIHLHSMRDQRRVFGTRTSMAGVVLPNSCQSIDLKILFPLPKLAPGEYFVRFDLTQDGHEICRFDSTLDLIVVAPPGSMWEGTNDFGVYTMDHQWSFI